MFTHTESYVFSGFLCACTPICNVHCELVMNAYGGVYSVIIVALVLALVVKKRECRHTEA